MGLRIGLLGLGSNLGERRAHLQAAVDALPTVAVGVLQSSSTYDTDPVGEVPDQPSFLNACLAVETALEPLELLDRVKDLERKLGRGDAERRHGPRAIDIDVLLLGELELRHERMSLPHAQLFERRFVLIPALELDFEYSSSDGRRLSDALAALPLEEGVRWAGPPLKLPAGSWAELARLRRPRRPGHPSWPGAAASRCRRRARRRRTGARRAASSRRARRSGC